MERELGVAFVLEDLFDERLNRLALCPPLLRNHVWEVDCAALPPTSVHKVYDDPMHTDLPVIERRGLCRRRGRARFATESNRVLCGINPSVAPPYVCVQVFRVKSFSVCVSLPSSFFFFCGEERPRGPVSLVLRGRTDSKSVSSETVQLSSGSSLICGRRHGKHTRALSHVCCRAHRMRAHADSLEEAVGGGMRGLHGREARVAQRTRQRILAQAADRDRVETADAAAEIEHSARILLFPCDKEWTDGVEREGRLHVACLREMRREHVEAIQAVRLVRTQRHVRNRRSPSGLVPTRPPFEKGKKKPLCVPIYVFRIKGGQNKFEKFERVPLSAGDVDLHSTQGPKPVALLSLPLPP